MPSHAAPCVATTCGITGFDIRRVRAVRPARRPWSVVPVSRGDGAGPSGRTNAESSPSSLQTWRSPGLDNTLMSSKTASRRAIAADWTIASSVQSWEGDHQLGAEGRRAEQTRPEDHCRGKKGGATTVSDRKPSDSKSKPGPGKEERRQVPQEQQPKVRLEGATFPPPSMTTAAIAAGRAKTAMATEKGIPVVPKTDKKDVDTELVMVLERRGEGWAEEVFPHVVMKRKPIPASRRTQKDLVPDTAQSFLTEKLGFSQDEAASIVSAAAAWRVTRGGRALVDRKLMRVVQENTPAAVAALLQVGASTAHIPTLLRNTPQILAVVPNSEWNRNLLEYIVRTKVPGGGRFGPLKLKHARRVPSKKQLAAMEKHRRKGEDPRTIRTGADPMKPWVEDVRKRRTSGQLSQEQLYMIDVAGFDAEVKGKKADESRRTWEMWFDELVEYQCMTGTCEVPEERDGAGLGKWLSRQKQKHRDGVLPEKARRRLMAMGVTFEEVELREASVEEAINVKKGKRTKGKSKSRSTESVTVLAGQLEAEAAAAMAVARAMMGNTAPSTGDGKGALEAAAMGGSGYEALDRIGVEMVQSLQAFIAHEGAFVEPPLGSQLAVWLSRVRARAAEGEMPQGERDALVAAGVELENFSTAWLGELERYRSLKKHRGTLHAPATLASWVKQQRAAAAAGRLSRPQLLRLRDAGMSGLAGALMLDDAVMEVVEVLVDPNSTQAALDNLDERPREGEVTPRASDPIDLSSVMHLRENPAAAEAAAAARSEAEAAKDLTHTKPQPVRRIPARAAGRVPGRSRRTSRQSMRPVRAKPRTRVEVNEENSNLGRQEAQDEEGMWENSTAARTIQYMKTHGY